MPFFNCKTLGSFFWKSDRHFFPSRITPELLEWLNQERWNDGDSNPETNSALVIRKLNKLMKLENEGY